MTFNHSTLRGASNGTTPKVGRRPPLPKHIKMAPCNGATSTAPSNHTTSIPSKLVVTRLAHYNGTLQRHHPFPPPQHTTMAPCNGTHQWHHVHSPKVGRHSPSTIVHYNSTLRWHPAMAPRPLHPTMAPWCHVQSAKVVRRPPPYWK